MLFWFFVSRSDEKREADKKFFHRQQKNLAIKDDMIIPKFSDAISKVKLIFRSQVPFLFIKFDIGYPYMSKLPTC